MRFANRLKRPFLLQLLATTIAVCFIPLTFLSVRMIDTQRKQMMANEAGSLRATADRIAAQIDMYLASIKQIQLKHQTMPELMDTTLSMNVSAEISAIDLLGILSTGQTYLKDNGFLCLGGAVNTAYLASGKHELPYYAVNELGMTEEELLSDIGALNAPTFLPWNGVKGCMVYLYPEMKASRTDTRRVGIYIIGRGNLLSALEPLTADGSSLDRIEDMQGRVVYDGSSATADELWLDGSEDGRVTLGDTAYYRCRVPTASGYVVYTHRPESPVADNLNSWTSSLMLVIIAVAVLTALCAVVIALMNYRPIDRAVRQIDADARPDTTPGEMKMITGAYQEQREKRRALEEKVEIQRGMMLDRIYKCLLGGRKLTNQEFELLHWQNDEYFVAVTDMAGGGRLDGELTQRLADSHIRVIGMKTDRFDAFVCFPANAGRDEQARQVRQILSALAPVDARLGVSRVYRALDDFHTAYVESMLAEQCAKESGAYYIEDIPRQRLPLFFENSFDTMQLINMLRNGDDGALERIHRMLNSIELTQQEQSSRLYAEFRVMEHLRGAIMKAGESCDEARFADIMGLPDSQQRRDAALGLVRGILKARREAISAEKAVLEQDMMLYVEQHCLDADFSLDMFSNRFGMTPSAASKAFKETMGENFKKYVNDRRLDRAKHLLDTTNDGVAQIAKKVGFSSASYFIQVFRTSEGVTPLGWRERDKGEEG